MKTGLITFHFVNNFGGALQCYALQRTLKEQCDTDVTVIDYRNWFIRFTDFVRMFPVTGNRKEIASGLRTFPQRIGRRRKFARFNSLNMTLSRPYHTSRSVSQDELKCDKYICGSDQIWNPILTGGFVPAYFLSFVHDPAAKASYAPSCGTGRWRPFMFFPVRRYIKSMGALSIREAEGRNLVKRLTGRDAKQLIDPTFLLSKEQWDEVTTVPQFALKEKYILLYIMQKDESVYSYVREIKNKLKLPVVEISRYGYKPDFVDKTVIDVGPSEFLGLFKNAEFICTNSYHGLVFSLVFEKEFCLVPSKKFRGRIYNLLKLLDIYIQPSLDTEEELKAKFDREHVDAVISEEKQRSLKYLNDFINGHDTVIESSTSK
ncbi:MAG: polysaccharide pyruvyl transferase family protein [Lachnospiraceae bacterium]|nr:polysaccharide pyruvyl transferase family protein [Lachnospiraceae bacterium]